MASSLWMYVSTAYGFPQQGGVYQLVGRPWDEVSHIHTERFQGRRSSSSPPFPRGNLACFPHHHLLANLSNTSPRLVALSTPSSLFSNHYSRSEVAIGGLTANGDGTIDLRLRSAREPRPDKLMVRPDVCYMRDIRRPFGRFLC